MGQTLDTRLRARTRTQCRRQPGTALRFVMAVILALGAAGCRSEASTPGRDQIEPPRASATPTAAAMPSPQGSPEAGGTLAVEVAATELAPERDVAPAAATKAPAPPPLPAIANGGGLNQSIVTAGLTLTLSVYPGTAGFNEVSIFFTDPAGGEGGVVSAAFRFTYLGGSARAVEVEAVLGHPGHFFVLSEHMPHAGRWRIEVTLRRPGLSDARAAFDVMVR